MRPTLPSPEVDPGIPNSQMSSSTELSPWHRVASFLLVVAWQFGSTNISLSSIMNSAHMLEAEFAASKILLIFWVTQGPVEPPFMYKRTNKMLLCLSVNLVDLMLRKREHSALKPSRSSSALENGVAAATLGGFGAEEQ